MGFGKELLSVSLGALLRHRITSCTLGNFSFPHGGKRFASGSVLKECGGGGAAKKLPMPTSEEE